MTHHTLPDEFQSCFSRHRSECELTPSDPFIERWRHSSESRHMLIIDTEHTRALIGGPASLWRGPEQATAACKPSAVAPREGHRKHFFSFFCDIPGTHQKCARKPSNKVRLNAARASKRRVPCLGMSWRRNELITLKTPEVRSGSYSMLR